MTNSRALRATSASCLLWSIIACGGASRTNADGTGGQGAGGSSNAGAPTSAAGASANGGAQCAAPSSENYTAGWVPPHPSMPGACSKEQLAGQAVCNYGYPSFDAQACQAFESAPENVGCLKCLFSTLGTADSAAIFVTPIDYRRTNVGGCIALLDGDTSETSCGARRQAVDLCFQSVCEEACTDDVEGIPDCFTEAYPACKRYADAASCSLLPQYSLCAGYTTYPEFVLALGNVFCGSGVPRPSGEAGASGDSE